MINTSGLPHFCLSVVPGRLRILDVDSLPLTSWADTLFYMEWEEDGSLKITPLNTVGWQIPGPPKVFASLQYMSEMWNTTADVTPDTTADRGGWTIIKPQDWTLDVLEDFVLDRPIRRDVERAGGQ